MNSDEGLLCIDQPTESVLPLSLSFPAYSKLNKRRRITCNQCGLPFGYVTMDSVYLESDISFLYEVNQRRQEEIGQASQENRNTNAFNEIKSMNRTHESDYHEALNQYLAQQCDYRAYMSVFLPDAINVHIRRRLKANQASPDPKKPYDKVLDPPGYPNIYKFQSDSLYVADDVTCVGCGQCVGVRYEPHSPDLERFIISWRTKRITRPSWKMLQRYDKNLTDQVSQGGLVESDWSSHTPFFIAEEGGWIAISLECVNIEPLFGLVGLDQYSIRYAGGEMYPEFYSSIESNSLFSQNSATWMIPWRRLDSRKTAEFANLGRVDGENWGKTYFDLERADKIVPHSFMTTDLVGCAMRELCPVYPIERKVLEPGEVMTD